MIDINEDYATIILVNNNMGIYNKSTTDHAEIQKWAAKYDGKPQLIDDMDAKGDQIGLRIDFPGRKDDPLFGKDKIRDISWEEFFEKFEELELGFIYDDIENLKDPGSVSRFVKRERMNGEYLDMSEDV